MSSCVGGERVTPKTYLHLKQNCYESHFLQKFVTAMSCKERYFEQVCQVTKIKNVRNLSGSTACQGHDLLLVSYFLGP